MNIASAYSAGVGKLWKHKRYLFLAYGINLLLALVLGAVMFTQIGDSVGHSAAGERLLANFDPLWFRSFAAQADGLARSFDPSVVGIGAVLNGLDALLTGNVLGVAPGILALGLLYLLTWAFLAGGLISSYAADQQASFSDSAARLFFRFAILTILSWIAYFLLFYFVLDWLNDAAKALTRESIDERFDFAVTLAKYGLLWLLILSVNLVFDYSKILTAVQDHKNPLTAPLRAIPLVFANFRQTYGLYFLIGLTWIGAFIIYWLIAPAAGQSSWTTIFIAFAVGQFYLLARIAVRCLFYAGQTRLFISLSKVNDQT